MDYHYRCVYPAVLMEVPETSYLDTGRQRQSRSNEYIGFLQEEEVKDIEHGTDEVDEEPLSEENKEHANQIKSISFIQRFARTTAYY